MIDVSVLPTSSSPYSIDDARRELRHHGIGRGLLAMRTLRHERANDAVAERGRPLLVHVDGPDWSGALLEGAQAHPRSREVFGW